MMIIEYDVVTAVTLNGLKKQVNKKLKGGWKLKGGISTNYLNYYQAIYREEIEI